MSHEAYAPVGYSYQAANYCLDCIAVAASRCNEHKGKDCAHSGYVVKGCNCAECRLDRMATLRGIKRMNEGSYDMDDFPKHIPYHNDLHSECGPEGYGYGPEDPEWFEQYCNATCTVCGEVIDGESQLYGSDKCPAYETRAERIEEMRT